MKTKTLLIISVALILILGLVTPVYGRYGQDFRREDTITLSPTGLKDAGIMQKAINNYETVILEDGIYAGMYGARLTLKDNVKLIGSSWDTILLFPIRDTAASGWRVENLQIDMTNYDYEYARDGIRASGSNWVIARVYIRHSPLAHNFSIYGSKHAKIVDSRGEYAFDDNFAMGKGNEDITILRNYAKGQIGRIGGSSGFEIDDGGSGFRIEGNIVEGGVGQNQLQTGFEVHMHEGEAGPIDILYLRNTVLNVKRNGFQAARVGTPLSPNLNITYKYNYAADNSSGFWASDSENVKYIGNTSLNNVRGFTTMHRAKNITYKENNAGNNTIANYYFGAGEEISGLKNKSWNGIIIDDVGADMRGTIEW